MGAGSILKNQFSPPPKKVFFTRSCVVVTGKTRWFDLFEVGGVRRSDPRTDVVVLWLANADKLVVSCAPMGDPTPLLPGDPIHVIHHPALQASAVQHQKVITIG